MAGSFSGDAGGLSTLYLRTIYRTVAQVQVPWTEADRAFTGF
jgi:hypothetical protein